MGDEGRSAVPVAQKGSWSTFLKNIANFSGDLCSLTAPPFILSPTSLVEFPSYWGEPTDRFAEIADGQDPEQRMISVLRWFVSTLSGQFTRRETQTGCEKKPLNPILGEQFIGGWTSSKTGATSLCAEQVSHHPPITAYNLQNKGRNLSYEGSCAQKTSFKTGTIIVRQVGHGLVRLKLPSGHIESYLVTLPRLRIEGLWYGSPYIELDGHSYIQSSSGWHVSLEYRGKGYFSGKSHTFTAKISSRPKALPIYTVEGQWDKSSKFIKPSFGKIAREGDIFLESEKYPEIVVAPLEQQGEWESRKVWKSVSDGIRNGDFDVASREKSRLENAQRARRKEEVAGGTPWTSRWFTKVPLDEEYEKLAQLFDWRPAQEDGYRYNEQGASSPSARGPWPSVDGGS